jgi:hypothetical protein
MTEIIVSSIVGAIIGLLIGVVFEETLHAAKKRFSKWVRTAIYRKRITVRKPETFSLGKMTVPWLVIDGDGELSYTPETIRCIVVDTPITLPTEIQTLRASIKEREYNKKINGQESSWNGPLYALERYAIGRTIPDENLDVVFTFRLTDYFTFQATVNSLDLNLLNPPATLTLRQKYLQSRDISEPIPFLSNGFGVALTIITGDQKLILTHRKKSTGVRAGELDVSVVEGIHPDKHRSTTYRGPDLYLTAILGALEELGISLVQDEIAFLGFGVDTEYYQWNLIGMARVQETAERLLESRTRGTGGKWETQKIEIIDADPKIVLNYLKHEKIWATGLVAIYWALVHEYGKKRVDSIVKEVFG